MRALSRNNGTEKWLNKAESLSKGGNHDEALNICQRVIDEEPDSYLAYEVRSSIHRRNGNVERALEDVGQVIRLVPNEAAPLFRRGRYQMLSKAYEAAAEDFSKALELDDGYFGDTLLFYRAEALLRCNDYEGALKDCKAMKANHVEHFFLGYQKRDRNDIANDASAGLSRAR